jgi:hypothetical protein
MQTPIFWSKHYLSVRKNGGELFLEFQENEWVQFHIDENQNQDLGDFPKITFTKNDRTLRSPFSASFGGIYLGQKFVERSDYLVKELNLYLRNLHFDKTRILLPPSHLSSLEFVDTQIYLENGWKASHQNLNHFVNLVDWSEDCLSKGNRKKLRQARESKLFFSEALPSDWTEAYEVVRKNRELLGAKVSMSEIDLLSLLRIFPDKYKCFTLKDGLEQITACAFLVETSFENIYVYLWADSNNYRNISPVVMLMVELVSTLKERYKFLDLGTSAMDGNEIEGLSRFKDNLGATRSYKSEIFWNLNFNKKG